MGGGYKLDNILDLDLSKLFITENGSNQYINNLVFEILIIYVKSDSSRVFNIGKGSLIFNNCDFRIKMKLYTSGTTLFDIIAGSVYPKFNNCIFNIDIFDKSDYSFGIFNTQNASYCTFDFNSCMFNLNIYFDKYIPNSISTNRCVVFSCDNHTTHRINFCGLFINLYNNTNINPGYVSIAQNSSVEVHNSYIIFNDKGKNTCKLYTNQTQISTCFYDSTLANGKIVADNTEYLLPLTTEQCKDAAYLESVGFIIST